MKKAIKKKGQAPIPVSFSSSKSILVIAGVILVLFFVLHENDTPSKMIEEKQVSLCSSESFPVCGKDGNTYTNSCTAEKIANVRVAYVGACREEISGSDDPINPTESRSEADSGTGNIEFVPEYVADLENTGATEISSAEIPVSISTLS